MEMKIFWDTNIFIYLVEKHPIFRSKVIALRQESKKRGDVVVTSALTLGELLVQPLRNGQVEVAKRYRRLLTGGQMVEMIPFGQAVAEHYARIRALSSISQPDAIQFACAAGAGCEVFVTNDRGLWDLAVPGVPTIQGL